MWFRCFSAFSALIHGLFRHLLVISSSSKSCLNKKNYHYFHCDMHRFFCIKILVVWHLIWQGCFIEEIKFYI